METPPLSSGRGRRAVRVVNFLAICLLTSPIPAATGEEHQNAGPRAGEVLFSLPATGEVIRRFDPPEQAWLAGHRGVDLAAAVGDVVQAAGDGTVAFAGVVVDRPLVSIDHPVGIRTTYEPVEPSVSAGDRVQRGQRIGVVDEGNAHCARPCLHWGARTGPKEYIDPLRLLQPPMIRLYPPEPW